MKTFIYGLIAGLLLSVGFMVYKYFDKEPEPEPVLHVVENLRRVDSLEFVLQQKDSLIEKSDKALQSRERVIKLQRAEIYDVSNYADSLELAYLSDKTIEKCDSMLIAKNKEISEKDTLIDELDLEAREYSDKIVLLVEKVNTQNLLLFEKDKTIDNLNCAASWKVNHRFWAWLLGWKCERPPNKK